MRNSSTNETSLKKLDRQLDLLRELAQDLDPFQGLGEQDKKKLKKAGIHKWDDPFQLTNELLKKLEDGLEKRMELTQSTTHSKTLH